MKIQLNEDYRVRTDGAYNFELERRVIGKPGTKTEGRVSWRIVGHFSHLGHALDRALNDKLICDTEGGATEALKVLNEFIGIAKRLVDKHLAANLWQGKEDS